jgi:Holliday junction resolvasome RuvABC DNA-binding subunit
MQDRKIFYQLQSLHSAGAAIALRMAELMKPTAPQIISINAALAPFVLRA